MYYPERQNIDVWNSFYSFMVSATVRDKVNLMGSDRIYGWLNWLEFCGIYIFTLSWAWESSSKLWNCVYYFLKSYLQYHTGLNLE